MLRTIAFQGVRLAQCLPGVCEDIQPDIQVREPVIERLDDMDTGKDDPTLQHGLPLTFPSTRRLPISCLQL
jgi:hypothetical protein